MDDLLYILRCFLLLGLACHVSAWTNLTVKLDYGTFQGKYNSSYNISYFRKIPFAASTAGENRFRAPQPPIVSNDVYDTDQSFDMCPQRAVNGSEDCLFLGLYCRPWRISDRKRPVLVNFYGGAFIEGSASFTIPPTAYPVLNVSDTNDFIIIYPNYRVNAFGFLPGSAVKASSAADLNPGLLDQQYALRWVNRYISLFGGDPHNVSIWGQSAGAGSVVAQVIANGGQTKPKLFTKALASSPFWPKLYSYDSPRAKSIYTQLVNLTGCGNNSDSLSCLKNVDVQTIRSASLIIDADNTYTTSSYTWAPVIDGDFLQGSLSEAFLKNRTNADFVFGMYNSHEGENFIPPGLMNATGANGFNSSWAGFDIWVQEPGNAELITSYNTTYERAQLVYRDPVLTCPAYWIAATAKTKGYLGEYDIVPAKHGNDTIYWNQVNIVQQTQPLIYTGYAGAFASFFQTGDPNAHKLTNRSTVGVPELRETEAEFAVEADGFHTAEVTQLASRCSFWLKNAKSVPI